MTKVDMSEFYRPVIGADIETRRGGRNFRAGQPANAFEKNLEVTKYAEATKLTVKQEREARETLVTASRKRPRVEKVQDKS